MRECAGVKTGRTGSGWARRSVRATRGVRATCVLALAFALACATAGSTPAVEAARTVALEGRVLDERGHGVSGAAVRVSDSRLLDGAPESVALTDGAGRFRFDALAPGTYAVTVTADGFRRGVPDRVRLEAGADLAAVLEVRLVPAVTLSGSVTDGDGTELEGARVSVATLVDADAGHATTDAVGAFAIADLPRAFSYDLRVVTRAGDEAALTVTCGDEAAHACGPARVVVTPRPALTARLVRPDGAPYAGPARVRYGADATPWTTVAAGALRAALPPGTFDVEVVTEGYRVTRRAAVTLRAGEPRDLGTLALDRGLVIRGRVTGSDRKPLAGVAAVAIGARAVTTADGTFELGGFEPGTEDVSVVFSREGFFPKEVKDGRPGGAELAVTLARTAAVVGRVVTGKPPQPVGEFTVDVFSEFAPGGESQPPGAGALEVRALPPAEVSLRIRATGFVTRWLTGLRLKPGEERNVGDVELTAAALVKGVVLEDRTGAPLREATVRADGDRLREARTDVEGRFALDLAPGVHGLEVAAERHAPATRTITAVVDGPELVVRVGGLGAIEGLVRGADGQPCAGCLVDVLGTGSYGQPAAADASGRFRREGLPPGRYLVFSSGSDRRESNPEWWSAANRFSQRTRRRVRVVSDEVTSVEIGAPTATLHVHGTVRADDEPPPGTLTWFFEGAGFEEQVQVLLDAHGAYEVDLDRPGPYRVLVGREDTETALRVTVGTEPDQSIELDARRTLVRGKVVGAATGAPLPRTYVEARRAEPFLDLATLPSATSATDETGRFALEVPPGTYRVAVRAAGFADAYRDDVKVEPGGELDLGRIALRDPRALRVRVLGSDGGPLQFATAALLGAAHERDTSGADASGVVVMTNAPPGPQTVVARGPGHALSVRTGVEAVPADVEPPSITLSRGGTLDVLVSGPGGVPLAGTLVRVFKDKVDITPVVQSVGYYPLFTSDEGRVHVPALEPGEYELAVGAGEHMVRRTVRVETGEARDVEISVRE